MYKSPCASCDFELGAIMKSRGYLRIYAIFLDSFTDSPEYRGRIAPSLTNVGTWAKGALISRI